MDDSIQAPSIQNLLELFQSSIEEEIASEMIFSKHCLDGFHLDTLQHIWKCEPRNLQK
jgi:hypothetical protein